MATAQRFALPAGRISKTPKHYRAKFGNLRHVFWGKAPSGAPNNDSGQSFSTRETAYRWGKYTLEWQVCKPYKAVETRVVSQSRGAPWLPVKLIYTLVARGQ